MRPPMPDCAQCQREEIRRADACSKLEQEALDRGEPYDCPCPERPASARGHLVR